MLRPRFALTTLAATVLTALSLAVGIAGAGPVARDDTVTISMLALNLEQPAFDVVIPNFERVYPHIKIDVTYAGSSTEIYQLETTELAAGNAPDLLYTIPGCGSPVSVCALAKSNYLAPLVRKPWVKWSAPLVTSEDKYGRGLYSFTAIISVWGIWTNDDLFRKLGLKVPATFSQLLDVCRAAKASGTIGVMVAGGNAQNVSNLIAGLAVATSFGDDKQWLSERRAGRVAFDTTAGWHQALQHFADMKAAGCFAPGMTGTTQQASLAEFAQGAALMDTAASQTKGTIDASSPQFRYSHHPLPGGANANLTKTVFIPNDTLGVNSHSSAAAQQAAQDFVDFIARPKQNALIAQIQGGVTQQQLVKGPIPAYMSAFSSVLRQHRYVITPLQTWWNASVLLALQQNQIGVITGQRSIDDVLEAMDAAWKLGGD